MNDGNIHCHVDNLSRKDKRHGTRFAAAKAAYNAGERIWSEASQHFIDFNNRRDIFLSRILLPENAPTWAQDRSTLWNKVDTSIKRKDARLAKSIESAITREIPQKYWAELLHAYASPFVKMGCVADIAIHEDGTSQNPHVHLLLTTRFLTETGFSSKITTLEQRAFVKNARKLWADLSNFYLEKTGSTLRVDHRSYKARGIESEPTKHRGPNQKERQLKREHAQRFREENTMKRPSTFEKNHYPNLTKRDTWPPEPEASRDYTPAESDEHRQYWDDQELIKLEQDYYTEPDPHPAEETIVEIEPEKPWYEQGLDNAKAQEFKPQQESEYATELRYEREGREKAIAHEQKIYDRALALHRTPAEHRYLNAAQNISPYARKWAEDEIILTRMAQIREKDHDAQLSELSQMEQESLKQIKKQANIEQEIERGDLPVSDPEGRLISQQELHKAQDRMLEEHHREERERVRGPNGEYITREELDRAQQQLLRDQLREEPEQDR